MLAAIFDIRVGVLPQVWGAGLAFSLLVMVVGVAVIFVILSGEGG